MGKGSDSLVTSDQNAVKLDSRLETSSSSPSSKTLYTWDEIKKHDKRNDCWIVVDDNVYNMTNFRKKHPGGSKVIDFYAGQDATVRIIFLYFFLI